MTNDSKTKNAAGSVGVVKTRYLTLAEKESDYLELDSGVKFGPVTVAYEIYGDLNADLSNAVLICHALSGNAHAAGWQDEPGKNPGWWDNAIGPGKAFDTDKYCVICSNFLGGCSGTTGPASINPAANKPWGMDFPVITIADMVKAQKLLLDRLGIPRLLAVAGGSMGGMQALEWGLRYPDFVGSVLVIAATSRLSAQGIAFDAVGRNSILSDPHWNQGDYYEAAGPDKGLAIARMIGHITYLSDEAMHAKFGRRLQGKGDFAYDFSSEFQVESYLDHQGSKFVERFDANSYLYITKAMDYFDLAQSWGEGDLGRAFDRVKSRVLVLSFSSDWLFPTSESVEIVNALIRAQKDVTYLDIKTRAGHDAFLLEVETEAQIIGGFLRATFTAGEGRRS